MLTVKEIALCESIATSQAQAVSYINEGCRRAIRKAYSDPLDNGELAREVFKATKPKFRKDVVRFFRKMGLNVLTQGRDGCESVIGDVLDRSKQAAVLAKLDDETALTLEYAAKAAHTEKPLKGFAADRLKKWLGQSIATMKKRDPDAAMLLNDLVQVSDVKTRLAPLAELNLTDSEVKALRDFAQMIRSNAFDPEEIEVTAVAEPLRIAA